MELLMALRRIDTGDIVGLTEIADRCGVGRTAVWNWRNRHEDFPAPLADLECGPIFNWPQVSAWLAQTGREV